MDGRSWSTNFLSKPLAFSRQIRSRSVHPLPWEVAAVPYSVAGTEERSWFFKLAGQRNHQHRRQHLRPIFFFGYADLLG